MALLTNFLTRRGAALLATGRIWRDTLRFAGAATITAFTPSAYNSATRTVVMKQIYFTAWQILPGFTLFAALLSYVLIQIVVTTAAKFGLSDYALEVSMRLLVLELAAPDHRPVRGPALRLGHQHRSGADEAFRARSRPWRMPAWIPCGWNSCPG
jgi:hypothetical protein